MATFVFAQTMIPLIKQAMINTGELADTNGLFNVLNTKVSPTHRTTNIQIMYKSTAVIDEQRVITWLHALETLLPPGTEIYSWEVFQRVGKLSRPNVVIRLTQQIRQEA